MPQIYLNFLNEKKVNCKIYVNSCLSKFTIFPDSGYYYGYDYDYDYDYDYTAYITTTTTTTTTSTTTTSTTTTTTTAASRTIIPVRLPKS